MPRSKPQPAPGTPLRAAIYIRRSTEEHQAASLEVQLDLAKQFVEKHGWVLDEASGVFVDDAKSRAEFVKRRGMIRMIDAAERRDFDVIVTRDETRLGGDMFRTGLLLEGVLEAGVRVFYYAKEEEVLLDNANAKFAMQARHFASELEREKTSQRTHEHLLRKAKQGLNVGGRVFGYANIEKKAGDARVHVEYAIHDAEVSVITVARV